MQVITSSKLKALISEGEINVTDLARETGLSRKTIYNFINDDKSAKFSTVTAITKAVKKKVQK